jgi:hypothetical protein
MAFPLFILSLNLFLYEEEMLQIRSLTSAFAQSKSKLCATLKQGNDSSVTMGNKHAVYVI